MRIGIAIDYGKFANSSSLNLIAKKVFLELGKKMNLEKNFVISALKYEDIGMGDVNLHFDCILVPNMGGYRFPSAGAITSKNLIVGVVGIDEVVLGKEVFKNNLEWKISKPAIKKEVQKWKEGIDKIKYVHVCSDSDKKQLKEFLGIPEKKLKLITLGVEHEKFKPLENKSEIRKTISEEFNVNGNYFVHLSEVNFARKNIFRIFEAYKKAKDEGITQQLVIIGRMESEVYKKAKNIKGIHILGYVSEERLIQILQCADVLIYPSLHEGFGLPALESMTCGTPVLTSKVFSLPELVGEAGILVDPYNIDEIKEKMILLANNKELRNELRQKGVEKSKEYTWENTSNKIFDLIKNTTKSKENFDFSENYEIAAYRTIITACEIVPSIYKKMAHKIMKMNYLEIIEWCLDEGLQNDKIKDFLKPYEDWMKCKINR